MLRGSKPLRMGISVAVAGVIGLVPAVMIPSPASAASPNLTISTATAVEGTGAVFTAIMAGSAAYPVTYNLSVLAGTATASLDYSATPSPVTLTFAAAGTQTVTVTTVDDALDEATETFSLRAINSVSSGDTTDGVGSITDNDNPPSYTLTATPAAVTEAPNAVSTIRATLSAPSDLQVVIELESSNGSAVAPRDYISLEQALVIPAGELTDSADVSIVADGVRDDLATETFTVTSSAINASPTGNSVTVSITDAQTMPIVSLTGGGSVAEGDLVTYTASILPASEQPVTVDWNAVAATPVVDHGTATPGTDFAYPSPRTVTIPAFSSATNFTILASDDSIDELVEDFAVELSNATNATLGGAIKANTSITDDNAAPTVTVTPITVIEGDSGKTARTFTATLDAASGRAVNVGWSATTDDDAPGIGYAAAVKDFTVKSGTLTIPAGTMSQTFTVDVAGDTVDEGAGETFAIRLSSTDGTATLGNEGITVITITDDDSAPTITFADKTVEEGDDGSAVVMPLVLNGSSDRTLVFNVAVSSSPGTASVDGDAVGQDDYDLLTDTVTVQAESANPGAVVALVNGDYIYEMDETAFFTVTAGNGALITDPDSLTAKLTIENDDAAPDLEINSIDGAEGDSVAVTGRVSGISATTTTVAVQFAGGSSMGSVAASASDFTNPGAMTVDIPAGTTPGTDIPVASVPLIADDFIETAETIIVTGFGLNNVGTVTEGIITIAASDGGGGPTDPETITLVGPYRTLKGPFLLTGMTTPDTEVQLWYAPYSGGDDDWSEGPTTTSSDTGAYGFTPSLDNTGLKFVVHAGETVSDELPVRLNQAPTLAGTSTTRGIAALRAGNGVPRQPFVIQRAAGSRWNSLFTGNLMSTGTYYKALMGQPSGRTAAYRVYVYGNSFLGIDGAYSSARYVRIR